MSNSEFFVDSPIMTAGAEIVFTVRRRFFSEKRTVTVDYTITAGTAVENTDYDGSTDDLTGTLTFNQWDIWKTIRINTMAGGASGDRTVICTLTEDASIRLGQATGTGTIQDGTVYFISSSGSSGNDGLSVGSPKDIGSVENLMKVTPAGGGEGRAIIFLDDETHSDFGGLDIDGHLYGGTIANPMIVGMKGNGARPIIYLSSPIAMGTGFTTNNAKVIFQDLELRPWSTAEVSSCLRHVTAPGYTEYTKNTAYHRIKMDNPDGHPGFRLSQINHCDGLELHYCEFFKKNKHGLLVGKCSGLSIKATYFHQCGLADYEDIEGGRDWAMYASSNPGAVIDGNHVRDCIQGFKDRVCGTIGEEPASWCYNHIVARPDTRVGGFGPSGSIWQWWRGTPGYGYEPLVGAIIECNIIEGGEGLRFGEADGYEEVLTEDQLVGQDITFRNNIIIFDQLTKFGSYYPITPDVLQVENFAFYHNTIVMRGIDYPAVRGGSNSPAGIWGDEIKFKNNIVVRLDFTTTAANALMYILGDPASYYDESNNHYFDTGGKMAFRGGTTYDTLADFQTAYPEKEVDSQEVNPVLIEGKLPLEIVPLAPIAAEAGLCDYDFYGLPRGNDTCAGAIHKPVATPAPVYVG